MPAAPINSLISAPALGRRTETQQFLDNATPESAKVLTRSLLDARLGNGTVAGGLNNQIRFRLRGNGPPSTREFVPDSKAAVDLLTTPAGPKLVNQLRVAVTAGDFGHPGKEDLKGFVLAPDAQSIMAVDVMGQLQSTMKTYKALQDDLASGDQTRIASRMKTFYRQEKKSMPDVLAWNECGWITLHPTMSRQMLTQVGAYRPQRGDDPEIRNATSAAENLTGTLTHEVEHSVTPPNDDYGKAVWMEEGIADAFSYTPRLLRGLQQKTGITPQSYAGHLAHKPKVDVGWKAWKPPVVSVKDQAKADAQIEKTYDDSLQVIHQLVNLSGADFRSNAGVAKARSILQERSLKYVPGRLADAIIDHNNLDPAVRERLRTRIIHANDKPGQVAALRREFGI